MKKAFTLIELLVVIAIIAILAAILFPVFAQAKAAAKKAVDLSNLKQMGTATKLYLGDYDDTLYPHRFNCNDPNAPTLCQEYVDGSGLLKSDAPDQAGGLGSPVNARLYWVYLLQPYAKNYGIFANPTKSNAFVPGGKTTVAFDGNRGSKAGNNYGGQNSYGHNDFYLSPAALTGGSTSVPTPPSESSIPRIASTIIVVDASYYGAGPDVNSSAAGGGGPLSGNSGVVDASKLNGNEFNYVKSQNANYPNYWKNIGDSDWTVSNISDADAPKKIQNMFGGKLNVQWADGHAKSLNWQSVVGNICYWTTDVDGAHPNCG